MWHWLSNQVVSSRKTNIRKLKSLFICWKEHFIKLFTSTIWKAEQSSLGLTVTGKGNKNRSVIVDWILLTALSQAWGKKKKTWDQVKVPGCERECNEIKKNFGTWMLVKTGLLDPKQQEKLDKCFEQHISLRTQPCVKNQSKSVVSTQVHYPR